MPAFPKPTATETDPVASPTAAAAGVAAAAAQSTADSAVTAAGLKLAKASNLSDVASASTARTNLGLGSAATTAATAYATSAQGATADSALALAGSKSRPILPWVTGRAYLAGEAVTNSGHTYTANDAHTSGATFAGDLAGHWTLLPVTASDVGAAPASTATDLTTEIARATAAEALRVRSDRVITKRNDLLLCSSRCYANSTYGGALSDGVITDGTSRIICVAARACGAIVLRFGNWYQVSTDDGPNNYNVTVKASVENVLYPSGTAQLVTFRGKTTYVLEPGGWIDSDPIELDLTAGQSFGVRTYVSVASGDKFPRMTATYQARSEGHSYGTPGTDLTTTYATLSSADAFVFAPIGVFAVGVDPSTSGSAVAMFGDSITYGVGDNGGSFGWMARALGTSVPWANAGTPSDRAQQFAASNQHRRMAATRGCTHATVMYGTNDLSNGRTAAQILADLATIVGRLVARGLTVYTATLPPCWGSSSDNYRTAGNQTVGAYNSIRATVNTGIRAGIAGATGYIETADAVETARDSGKWNVLSVTGTLSNGTTGITGLSVGHGLQIGTPVYGTHIQAATTITALPTSTTATMSKTATSGATTETITAPFTADATHPTACGHQAMANVVTLANFT